MKRIRRIAAMAAVMLFILSCGLFASAESVTTSLSVSVYVEDVYITKVWDMSSQRYYPWFKGNENGVGYRMSWDNLSGITSGYVTVLFSSTSPMYVFNNGRKFVVSLRVKNDCGWTDPSLFEMLITTGNAWAGGQPVIVSSNGEWTDLQFEFDATDNTGDPWYPYGFRFVFLKGSSAAAHFI